MGYDSEAGVAIVLDNVYIEAPILANSDFYDLGDVEVLAGPQSTLYGRGAVGGVVSMTTARPDLDAGSASLMASYGNYNAKEVEGDVNLPLVTDELGLRISGDWIDHSGYVTNIYNNSHPDNEKTYSFRGSLRWEPSSNTTIDLSASFTNENDNAMRSQKQLCTTDITGVLGCLPTSAGTQPVNGNSNLSTIASSVQGMSSIFGPGLGSALGLYNLTVAPTLPVGFVDPSGARQINTDFNPTYQTNDQFVAAEWKQTNILSWLDADLVFGYDHNSVQSQESYNNIPGVPLPEPNLAIAEGTFLGTMAFLGGPAYAAHFAPYFSVPGELPISSTHNLGIIGGDYSFTPNAEAYDQSSGEAGQYSLELRFDTHFSGPLNFRLGGYYLNTQGNGHYYVNGDTLDYPEIILGGFGGLADPAKCFATGCITGPSFYDNDGNSVSVTSKAIYGEGYFTAIPDTLKLTVGLRYTEDNKTQQDRIELYDGLIPIGTTDEQGAVTALLAPGPAYIPQSVSFNEWTGHATLDWTPKLSFTDQTLVYGTFSRGYKAGGFNPGIEAGNAGSLSPTYNPEFINDFELGTKNTLLNGTLQANADLWYYDYTGLQVSEIVNNTSINNNINAKLYGAEGQFIYQPIDQLQFSLNIAETHSGIAGGTNIVDSRNPTNGDPKAVLVKDDSISAGTGNNCVFYYTGAGPTPSPATLGIPGFYNPAGGPNADASSGIAVANFGSCSPTTAQWNALAAAGFANLNPNDPTTLATRQAYAAQHKFVDGEETSLSGNELQDTPDFNTTIGVQWTQPVGGDYNLVAHVDYYWQSHMWGRIFEDGADRINSFGNMNATLTLNAPDNKWFVQAFIKNVFGTNAIQGEYLTSPTSGLYTNAVYGDPRLYGLKVGIKL